MYYDLSNGKKVSFRSNIECAKFVYLVMPFKGLTFTGPEKPRIVMNSDVQRILRVYNKLLASFQQRDAAIERAARVYCELDDDIPF